MKQISHNSSLIKIGILSTIDSPLLPFYLKAAKMHDIKELVVICDSKISSEKDKAIWADRTGDFFSPANSNNPNIYNFTSSQIPFYFVENHNSDECLDLLKHMNIQCLFNGGTPRKISNQLIEAMPHGILNVHPGILPEYRGCSAVEWAIYNDDKIGNTVHFMDEGYDTGPILFTESYEFLKNASYKAIRTKVYSKGCELAGKALSAIQKNNLMPKDAIPQSEDNAHYWNPIPNEKMTLVLKKISDFKYAYQSI